MIILANNYRIIKSIDLTELEFLYLKSPYKMCFKTQDELSVKNKSIYNTFKTYFENYSNRNILENPKEKVFKGKCLNVFVNTNHIGGVWLDVIGSTDDVYIMTYFFAIDSTCTRLAYLIGDDAEY